MPYKVLVVKEVWHCRDRGRHVERGEVILDQDEVAKVLAERPHSVTPRMAHPHEVELIEAAKAAGEPAEPEMTDAE